MFLGFLKNLKKPMCFFPKAKNVSGQTAQRKNVSGQNSTTPARDLGAPRADLGAVGEDLGAPGVDLNALVWFRGVFSFL